MKKRLCMYCNVCVCALYMSAYNVISIRTYETNPKTPAGKVKIN